MTDLLITFLASFLIWIMYGGIIVLWIIDGRIKREVALHAFVAAIFSSGLAEVLKSVFHTIRPYILNGTVPLTISAPGDGAFPSGHAAQVFALAITIWLHDKRLGSVFCVGAILVAVARIWANVHFPSDVIAGALIGSLVAILFERLHVFKLTGRGA